LHISGVLRRPSGFSKNNHLVVAKHVSESAYFCDMFCKVRKTAA
jgi:hypothetical protein